ncbi:hypothetical protein KAH81_07210 [bacterium]|nr:hypothetical protein [bacterium]
MQKKYSPTEIKNKICDLLEKAVELSENRKFSIIGYIENLYDHRDASGWLSFFITDGFNRLYCTVEPEIAAKIDFPIYDGARVKIISEYRVFHKTAQIELSVLSFEDISKTNVNNLFIEMKNTLSEEGLLSQAELRKISLDPPPKRIAIVAPENSSAFSEFEFELLRAQNPEIHIYKRPFKENSPDSLIDEIIKCTLIKEGIDLIVVAETGGKDISVFNNKSVIREVAKCQIPVLSAIGYAIDRTLLDYIASETLPTPTAAGQWLYKLNIGYMTKKKEATKKMIYIILGMLIPLLGLLGYMFLNFLLK